MALIILLLTANLAPTASVADPAPETLNETNVLVAVCDIPEGSIIDRSMYAAKKIPLAYATPDPLTESDLNPAHVRMIAHIPIPKGSQIGRHQLVRSGKNRVSMNMGEMSVGVAIPVDTRFLSLIEPGDRVDILSTFDREPAEKNERPKPVKRTGTIVQNAVVLEKTIPATGTIGTLLVSVNPTESTYLLLALKSGPVSVLLRNPRDHDIHPIEATDERAF